MVHDKAIKVGGKQHIETLDGYIIPLNISSGLPYITICPYTDTEWDNLPHVILTADMDWDPTILDHEMEDREEWFDAMQDLPVIEPDPLFNVVGNYKLVHHATEAMIDDNLLEMQIISYQDLLLLYNHNVVPSKIDYKQY